MACCTVVIFSASSSGISVSNSSSSAITSSTVSSESAPRSSTNDDSVLISASLTPSCSATIFLTRCSTCSIRILLPSRGCKKARVFYQIDAVGYRCYVRECQYDCRGEQIDTDRLIRDKCL